MKLIRVLCFLGSVSLLTGVLVACGPAPPPDPPTNITKKPDLNVDGKIEWFFEIPEKDKDRVAKIYIYRDTSSSGKFTNEVGRFTMEDGKLDKEKRVYQFHFIDTNVLPGDKYGVSFYYKFVCEGKDGKRGKMTEAFEAKSSNAEVPKEVANQKVISSNISDGPQITVTWSANTEYDIKGYYVFRSEEDKTIFVGSVDKAVSPMIKHVRGKTLSWIDENVQEGKPYWYVVVAVDKEDQIGRRRPGTRFRGMVLAKANLVAPADGSNTAKPTFKWDPVDSAAGYIVVLLDDAVGGEVVWRSDYTTNTELTYPDSANPLTSGKKYYWYVYTYLSKPQSNDEKGNSRSELWSFTAQ